MRKIVDSNYLQSDELRKYLSKSRSNMAVLTDYAAMEAYNGNALAGICQSMSVLCEFPKQVIILKNTRIICGLSGRSAGLQKRFIDESQTKGFCQYCRYLSSAAKGDKNIKQQLISFGEAASKHLDDTLLSETQFLPKIYEDIAKTFSESELSHLRGGKTLSNNDELIKKIMKQVLEITTTLLENHPNVRKWPSRDELFNTFIFRMALCEYLLAIFWISEGRVAKGVNAKKLRNDRVDANFAAYATFFDGLFSKDDKAKRTYQLARIFLPL